MDVLEHKYSTHQPELLLNGSYIGRRIWKFTISDSYVTGSIMHSVVKPLLTFETYWHPFNDLKKITDFVHAEAKSIPAGRYKSLCLLNSMWPPDIKQWAQNYVHPRLITYLYELETNKITYNRNVANADRLRVWHDQENYLPLKEQIASISRKNKILTASVVAEKTGLSTEGAKRFLSVMKSENKRISSGLQNSRYSGDKHK